MFKKVIIFTSLIHLVPAKEGHSSQYVLKHEGHAHKIEIPYTHKDEHGHIHHYTHVDYFTHPKYKFGYKVKDPHTHDIKEHHEHRDGDKVTGYYSLHQPDGSVRHVHYNADHHSGFHADVKHNTHHVKHKKKHHHHHEEPFSFVIPNEEPPNYGLFKPPPEHEFQQIVKPIIKPSIELPSNIDFNAGIISKFLHHHDHHHHHHVDYHPHHKPLHDYGFNEHQSPSLQDHQFHQYQRIRHRPTHHHHRQSRSQHETKQDHHFQFPKHLHLPDFHFKHPRSHKPKVYHNVLSPKYDIYYTW